MRKSEAADEEVSKRTQGHEKRVQGAADTEPGAHPRGHGAAERRRALTGQPPEEKDEDAS